MDYWRDFIGTIEDLLRRQNVKAMQDIRHHHDISCYEHCIFVSYTAYCIARKRGLDFTAAARAGLLHDFYLYDSYEAPRAEHIFQHASRALKNAKKICSLSRQEENIILSHMWPLPGAIPKSREAVIVNMCDKYCASIEGLKIWNRTQLRQRIQEIAF